MRERASVTTLRQCRIEASDKFAEKCLTMPRFSSWLPLKPPTRGRNSEKCLEKYARCNRLRDTPIFYIQRRLNGKPGRTYGERNRRYWDTWKFFFFRPDLFCLDPSPAMFAGLVTDYDWPPNWACFYFLASVCLILITITCLTELTVTCRSPNLDRNTGQTCAASLSPFLSRPARAALLELWK